MKTSWTADEIMATDFPEPRFAVPGIVAEGLNLLVGAPKLGKSWLTLTLGIAVASGGSALGKIPVDQGTCCTSPWRTAPDASRGGWG